MSGLNTIDLRMGWLDASNNWTRINQISLNRYRTKEETSEFSYLHQIVVSKDLRMLNPGSPFRHIPILPFQYFLEDVENNMVGTISNAVNILRVPIL